MRVGRARNARGSLTSVSVQHQGADRELALRQGPSESMLLASI
jgi:hypothetical protein